ncbi:MAG: hypothetical protein K9L60_10310 [Methylovulum sp.]|jgi:hypothetical protein|nr:hypothetical protein [Methylovulum sp.]MCF7999531.1 hypothetical protein [Methylovulum sp.]
MPDKILDTTQFCQTILFDHIYENNLDLKVKNSIPNFVYSLPVLTLAWLTAALDYVMIGEGKVGRQHKKFINALLNTHFTVIFLINKFERYKSKPPTREEVAIHTHQAKPCCQQTLVAPAKSKFFWGHGLVFHFLKPY